MPPQRAGACAGEWAGIAPPHNNAKRLVGAGYIPPVQLRAAARRLRAQAGLVVGNGLARSAAWRAITDRPYGVRVPGIHAFPLRGRWPEGPDEVKAPGQQLLLERLFHLISLLRRQLPLKGKP